MSVCYECPCCGVELYAKELSKGKCGFCGEMFDADEVAKTFNLEETVDDCDSNNEGDM